MIYLQYKTIVNNVLEQTDKRSNLFQDFISRLEYKKAEIDVLSKHELLEHRSLYLVCACLKNNYCQ